MNLRSLLSVALCALALAPIGAVQAQEWPTKPVRIIVPYPPGTSVDTFGRALAEKLSQKWGQAVVIDNKPGGNEAIALTSLAHEKADGYTLGVSTESGIETNPMLYSKLSYDPVKDLTPITRMFEGFLVYIVRSDSPYATMAQLLDAARKAPGKIAYGSSGIGGGIHVPVHWLSVQAGNVEFNHIPYRGSTLVARDILAGNLQFSAIPVSVASPFIADGRVRQLAVTSALRLRTLPDVPTLTELGYKDSVSTYFAALVGPAQLPKALAARIAADVRAVIRQPEFLAKNMEPFGLSAITDTPEEFDHFLLIDREKQRIRVKAANVKLD